MENLADEVVILRPWREDDVAGMLGFADPLVQRFSWPLERGYTEADARAYLDSLVRGDELGFALAEPGREDRAIGGASLRSDAWIMRPERSGTRINGSASGVTRRQFTSTTSAGRGATPSGQKLVVASAPP